MTTADRSTTADTLPEYRALAGCMATTLEASARVLAGDRDAVVDVDALDTARDAHTHALETWTAATLDADDAAPVVDRFSAAFP